MKNNINLNFQKTFNKIPLKKFFNKLFWSNIIFGYAFLILILSCVFGNNAYNGEEQFIGNIVLSIILMMFGLFSSFFWTYKMYVRGENPYYASLQFYCIVSLFILPLFGSILIYIWKMKEQKIEHIKNKEKNINYAQPKKFIPTSLTILFFLILFVILAIWIVYIITGGIQKEDGSGIYQVPGILDVFIAPFQGFSDAADLVVFLLIMGGFLQIINETKALEAGIGSLVQKMKGKEIWLIPILMLLFSIGGTTFGMCEEALPFYFIVIPILIAGGFDAFTGFLVVLLGAGIGTAGSVINPFVVNSAIDAIKSQGIDIAISDGIIWRIAGYLIILILSITMVTLYAKKVKVKKNKSVLYNSYNNVNDIFKFEKHSVPLLTKQRKIVLIIFAFSFLFMVVSVVNWADITGSQALIDFNNWLEKTFPFISSNGAIGTWYLLEMSFVFFIASFIISLINWNSEEKYINSFLIGAKDFLPVAVIIATARGLSIVLSNSGVNTLITSGLSPILGGNAQMAAILLFFIFIFISFFIPSTSGFASVIFPIISPSISSISVSSTIPIFSFANGFVNLISPTAGPFVAGLSLTKISLLEYYKGIWKIILVVFIAMFALVLIGSFMPSFIA